MLFLSGLPSRRCLNCTCEAEFGADDGDINGKRRPSTLELEERLMAKYMEGAATRKERNDKKKQRAGEQACDDTDGDEGDIDDEGSEAGPKCGGKQDNKASPKAKGRKTGAMASPKKAVVKASPKKAVVKVDQQIKQ